VRCKGGELTWPCCMVLLGLDEVVLFGLGGGSAVWTGEEEGGRAK
jgi:hypothetical protein